MGDASTALQSGIGALAGTGAMYDPNSYQDFMNPYEDQVIDNTLADIRRQGDIAQRGVASGRFWSVWWFSRSDCTV